MKKNETRMKKLSLASIKRTVRNTLNYDEVVITFNIFGYCMKDMSTKVLKVIINTYYNDDDKSKTYIVVVNDLPAGESQCFNYTTKNDVDPVETLANRIADIAYSILWDTMQWLDCDIALSATPVAEKYCLGLQWYVNQAEKLIGETYHQDAPSYVRSKIVRNALKLLYLRESENISAEDLEIRINDYLDLKELVEN